MVVTGLSGMGKSRLVFTYAKKHAHKYRVVWVFDASNTQGMDNQMIDFANKLYALEHKGKEGTFSKKNEATHYVKTLLRTCAFSWLLIFDGASSFASATGALPEIFDQRNKHSIVASTSSAGAPQVLEVGPLDDVSALSLLKEGLPDYKDEDLQDLARALENHPLALNQAVSYIKLAPSMDPQKYITLFNDKVALWSSEAQALQGQVTLHTALKIHLEDLTAEDPTSLQSLCFFAMIDTHNITQPLIDGWYEKSQNTNASAFGQLTSRSLLTTGEDGAYTMQGYLRCVILHVADETTKRTAATTATKLFAEFFSDKIADCVEDFQKNPGLFNHARSLFDHADFMPAESAFHLGMRLLHYSERNNRDFEFAVPQRAKLKELFDAQDVKDHMAAGLFYTNYGCTVLTGGTVDDSLREFEKAYAAFKAADPKEARLELASLLLNELGFFTHWKADSQKVRAYLDEAHALIGDDAPDYLRTSQHELEAVFEQDQGHHERALAVLDKSAPLFAQNEDLRTSCWPFSASLKACSLVKLERYEEARTLCNKAIEVAIKHADGNAEDDQVGRIRVYLSQAQSGLGDYVNAEANARSAIDIIDGCYGEGVIRRQGVAYMALGDALKGQGKRMEAAAAYQSARDIFEKISAHVNFDDMSELLAKMYALGLGQQDTPEGQLLMMNALGAHQGIFDKEHPRFVKMVSLSIDPAA
ncbi:MAG: hypothetical protein C0514_02105 [Candidatus Puniceispirillum sp.]|nr:hypothetical protein [Candidatus Puniceispirillum sp.]